MLKNLIFLLIIIYLVRLPESKKSPKNITSEVLDSINKDFCNVTIQNGTIGTNLDEEKQILIVRAKPKKKFKLGRFLLKSIFRIEVFVFLLRVGCSGKKC